jgi:hypothetical protein
MFIPLSKWMTLMTDATGRTTTKSQAMAVTISGGPPSPAHPDAPIQPYWAPSEDHQTTQAD